MSGFGLVALCALCFAAGWIAAAMALLEDIRERDKEISALTEDRDAERAEAVHMRREAFARNAACFGMLIEMHQSRRSRAKATRPD